MLHEPTVYLDDSGGKDTGVVVFAGFVSTLRKWARFEREWKHVLAEYPELDHPQESPRMSYLHMKEFMHDSRISEGRREKIELHLAHIAQQSTLFYVSVAVEMSAYAEFQTIVKNVDYYGRSAYSFCFQSALGYIHNELSEQGYQENFSIVFDDGPQMVLISELYNYIKNQNFGFSKRLESLSFKDDKVTPPLQAADMIAWESHKYAVGKIGGVPRMTKTLMSFARNKRQKLELSRIWDKSMFIKMLDAFKGISLDGVPLELVQTPEGQLKAAEIFSRNMDKINSLGLSPEFWVPCQEAVLVEGKLYRKKGTKFRDSEPIKVPLSSPEIVQ